MPLGDVGVASSSPASHAAAIAQLTDALPERKEKSIFTRRWHAV